MQAELRHILNEYQCKAQQLFKTIEPHALTAQLKQLEQETADHMLIIILKYL